MRKLIKYLKPYYVSIIVVLILAMASTVFTIISPKILGDITNEIVAGIKNITQGGIDFSAILHLITILVGLYLIGALCGYLQGWIMTGITQKVTYNLRKSIALKINRLPLRYFDTQSHGDILSRVTNDVDTVSHSFNQSLTQVVTAVTTIVGILIMMIIISWQLTLVAVIVLPLGFLLARFIIKKSQKYFFNHQVSLGEINGHIEEMFSGHTIVKAFNGEQKSISTFRKINNKLYNNAWKSQFFSGLLHPIMNFLDNAGFVAVSVLGGWFAIRGKMTIGSIQAFIQYLNQFSRPIIQTASIANVFQSTAAAAERAFEFLEEEEELPDPAQPKELKTVKGAVDFVNVVFGYTPEKIIINNFSATIKPGQKIAIVGPTGAGKTTMVNLLMRFYEIDSGAIKIDGVDIKDLRRSDLRKLFGMVLQDTWLFSGTIEENIAYGKDNVSHEEVVKAAQAAYADHFIHTLPGDYQMEISEEADNISQGEKQLLTIARAILANAPMLILDEATSSVDTRTEALIQAAMDKMMEGRTSFIIAHRLSTIRNADLILVMRDGHIVEQGTHKQLLAQNGFYASLYNSQFVV
ncbi:MAG TPA: ABC transporter ATP-binding protein [bacterium]|nr:ABC transporter ATP-binding protein [bacterium]HOS99330.1 ABC transporter ATP-binding protein [bacterium]HPL83749.1 ABC transporter ATP-binding protein [bacterium]HQE63483.1 ABC transporter ATP-binding protein [bacterium]HQI10799.1 ABC transporter ATP-binding protein [bacterium]